MRGVSLFGLLLFALALFWYFSPQERDKADYLYKYDKKFKSVYTLEFVQKTSLVQSEFIPKEIDYEYSVRANLHMRVYKKSDAYIWTLCQLSSFTLEGKGVNEVFLKSLRPYYESMFLFKHDANGKILDIKFPGKFVNFSGLAQLMYLLEVINRGVHVYREEQSDNMGSYEAFYKKNKAEILKQKTRYSLVDKSNEVYDVAVSHFAQKALVDIEANWLKSAELEEKLTLYTQNTKEFAHNTNSVKLSKIDTKIQSSLGIYTEKRKLSQILKDFSALEQSDKDIFQKIADENMREEFVQSNTTIDSLAQNLTKSATVLEIKRYLSLFPNETEKLEEIIYDANDTTSMRLIAVIANLETNESQQLLSKIAKDSQSSSDDKLRCIIALGGMKNATRESLDTLVELSSLRGDALSEELSDTSLLALASHASSQENKEEILSYIRSQYSDSPSLSKEKNILLAIQNAGAENFVDEINHSLSSNSIKVRLLAINTVATIQNAELRKSILTRELQTQSETKVKELIEKILAKN